MKPPFYDVTLTISDTLITWPADPAVSIRKTSLISRGDPCNLSELTFGSHCGTHIDVPYHLKENGISVDHIPLDALIGNAKVFEIKNKEKIDAENLKSLEIEKCERVIFKTINSTYWKHSAFIEDFVYLTQAAAAYLAMHNVKLVGIDYLSVDKFDRVHADVHHILLNKGIIIIEGLDLNEVKPGEYELIALPLKIKDGDGSPARVVLRGHS
ncbi:MAG: hypothetical protein B6D35_09080 [Candidatus Brocadia sp. UTAMX2]|jgi:arylformamidase|nr:MAG: hypothetical protein B6D35_09080 [Candidatus Brocadia sp. UTAMX2]